MSIICDHPGCGAPAKRTTLKLETWNKTMTFENEDIDIRVTEFSADLCDQHCSEVLAFARNRMSEREDG